MSFFSACVTAGKCYMMELARVGWMVTSSRDDSQLCYQLRLYPCMLEVEEAHSKTSNQDRYSFTPVYTHGNRKVQSGYLHDTSQKCRQKM